MEQLLERDGSSIATPATKRVRNVYVSPHLLKYGSVAKLTRNNTGSVSDGMSGLEMAMTMLNAPGSIGAPKKRR